MCHREILLSLFALFFLDTRALQFPTGRRNRSQFHFSSFTSRNHDKTAYIHRWLFRFDLIMKVIYVPSIKLVYPRYAIFPRSPFFCFLSPMLRIRPTGETCSFSTALLD